MYIIYTYVIENPRKAWKDHDSVEAVRDVKDPQSGQRIKMLKAINVRKAGLLRTGKVPLAYHSRAHAPLPQRWPDDKAVWITSAI